MKNYKIWNKSQYGQFVKTYNDNDNKTLTRYVQ